MSLEKYKSGDIVKITKNSKGYISNLETLYEYGTTVDGSNYKNTFNSASRYMLVYVNDRIGPLVKVGYRSGTDFDEVFNLENAPIVVYDASIKGDKVQKGTYADVLAYNSTGRIDHKMFIQRCYEDRRMVVIYKD